MNCKRWIACTILLSVTALPLASIATISYVVKRGDTLWSIAAHHRPKQASVHQTISAIQALNGPLMANSSAIHTGQALMLPSNLIELKAALHPGPISAQPAGLAPANAVVLPANISTTSQSATSEAGQTQGSPLQPISNASNNLVPLSVNQQTTTPVITPVITPAGSQESTSAQTENFPWGWTVFTVLLLGLAYVLWHRKIQEALPEEIKRFAALRLGISSRRQEPVVTKYKTRHFKESLSASSEPPVDSIDFNREDNFAHDSADAMAGAMIDMAEMNYDGAERLLQGAIEKDPENIELRLKLLELYMATDNQIAFKKEAEQVERKTPENSPIWHQVRGMYLNQWAYDA